MDYKFNKEKRYVTKGINNEVPFDIQLLMWDSIDELIESEHLADYLQVFRFKVNDSGKLEISHTQEQHVFKKVTEIKMKEEYNSLEGVTIFVIDDITHCTALLSNEY
jgi:ribosomal protein L35